MNFILRHSVLMIKFMLGRIVVTESIPKTATGKIQRRHVRDAMLEREEGKNKVKAKL